jgi:hypothetical protein
MGDIKRPFQQYFSYIEVTNKLFRYRDIEIPHVMASRVVVQLPTNGVRALITYPVFTQHHLHIEMLMLFLMLFHRRYGVVCLLSR